MTDFQESDSMTQALTPSELASDATESALNVRFSTCQSQTAGTSLDLSDLSLTEFPIKALTLFPLLRKLNLRKNALSGLPSALAKYFPHLTVLNASHNVVTELPLEIGALRYLQKLQLEGNQIGELPPTMSQMIALEELDLRGNALQSLDEYLGSHLPRLRTLLLANNQLSSIPRSFSNFSALQEVDLSGNGEMVYIPDKIRRLHERHVILHSRSKRRELISRALRVRSAVAQIQVHAKSVRIIQ